VALTCVRLQVLSSGKEQLKNLLGFINNENSDWEIQFRNVVDLNQVSFSFLKLIINSLN
jgi:hypothetical protein